MPTIVETLKLSFPYGTNPRARGSSSSCPEWPPDLFAVAATLLERSSAYAELGCTAGWDSKAYFFSNAYRREVIKAGAEWARTGNVPHVVRDLWQKLRRLGSNDVTIESLPIIMRLMAAADEASWDKSTRSDGTFSRADFVFDRGRNVYICPGGKLLHTTGTVIDGGTLRYRASKIDCDVCAFKVRCCPSTSMRYVPRDLHEDARDVARSLAKTEAFEQSRRERKKVEMRFAHMKRIFKLDRLRLRGLSGAKDEVLLTATPQNLRRLVKFLCRPPPSAAVPCAA
jgi:Transposase DDE domain